MLIDMMESEVCQGQWVSEIALWTQWVHKGWLEAVTSCELLDLSADGLQEIVTQSPEVKELAKGYGMAICQALSDKSSDVNLGVNFDVLVTSMPLKARVMMSQPVIDTLRKQQGKQQGNHSVGTRASIRWKKLELEVQRGECDVVKDGEGCIYRIKNIAVLRLMRSDGLLLVQIWEPGHEDASAMLPGTKLQIGELPQNAVQRLLTHKFPAWPRPCNCVAPMSQSRRRSRHPLVLTRGT